MSGTDYIYNRTMRYLSPILHTYPVVFQSELNKNKFNLAVCDVDYYKSKKKEFQSYLFLQFKTNQKLIDCCRQIRYYVDEYPLNLEDKYVVVLSIPEEFKESYQYFLKGQYSKMYTKSQLERIKVRQILNGNINGTYLVLTKNPAAYEEYCQVIKTLYKSEHYPDKEKVEEFDIPPRINQEVFNFKNNIEWVKQNTPLKIYIPVD